jgi:hypothetical protein
MNAVCLILETGNHIAQNGNGHTRRQTATRFCAAVTGAFTGEAPYQPSEFPNSAEILNWLNEFPDFAGQNKSPSKLTSKNLKSAVQDSVCRRFSYGL